jgi:ubiquinone/menaquinone biosynthesis C-methylase UbiE
MKIIASFFSTVAVLSTVTECFKFGLPRNHLSGSSSSSSSSSGSGSSRNNQLHATLEKKATETFKITPTSYAEDSIADEGTMFQSPVFKFFDFLLGIPLIHDVLFGVYRMQIKEKSEKMGLPWTSFMEEQWDNINELRELADLKENPDITIPDYYYAPIHAYKDGNLCWDSALEEDLWSKLMIAPLYNNALDGDVQMRQEWLAITAKAIKPNPVTATDLGCGTGLSMYMLDSKFPTMEKIQGVDLSTFKLAVCEDKKSMMPASKGSKYEVRHEAAEHTTVASNSQDLASLCLVAHESPRIVSKAIFEEAFRILKPGGSLTMLDLDKENLEVLLDNPFVAAIYKRTEPYMPEFLTLDPKRDLAEAGFVVTSIGQASKSHRVYVAQKPELSSMEAKLQEQGLLQ